MSKRIVVDPANLPWKILPSMVVYGTDLLARCEQLKEETPPGSQAVEGVKRRRKAGDRLRDLDPW